MKPKDEIAAARYQRKARKRLFKLRRWAKRVNKKSSLYGRDYGRRRGIVRRTREIDTNRIIES